MHERYLYKEKMVQWSGNAPIHVALFRSWGKSADLAHSQTNLKATVRKLGLPAKADLQDPLKLIDIWLLPA